MSYLPFLHFFCFLVYLYLAVFIIYRNHVLRLNQVGSLLLVFLAIWSFGKIFIHNPATSRETVLLFGNISSIGWFFFAGIGVWIAFVFSENKRFLKSKLFYICIFIPPILLLYRQWTVPFIHYSKLPYGWTDIWEKSFWSYFFYLYIFVSLVISHITLFSFYKKLSDHIKRRQIMIAFASAVTSLLLGFITDFFLPSFNIYVIPDIMNVFFLIWAIGLGYSILKYRLFVLTPAIAADKILATISDALVLIDNKGRIQTANMATMNLLGYQETEIINKPLTRFFKDVHLSETVLNEYVRNKFISNIETIAINKDGKEIPVLFSSTVMKDANDIYLGDVCLAHDITERKKAELSLLESEDKFRNVVETCTDGIWIIDLEGKLIWANETCYRMIGYKSFTEIKGISFLDYTKGKDSRRLFILFVKMLKSEESIIDYEFTAYDKFDRKMIIETSATVRYNPQGEPIGFQGFSRDITHKIQMQNSIAESLKEKELLLREIHHRVKNNMQIISSLLTLQSRYIDEEKYLEMFNESRNRIKSMALIHEKLYQSSDLSGINFREYIKYLARGLFQSYNMSKQIDLQIDVRDIFLDIETALPVGLLLNEMISNSLKHAFIDDSSGKIIITLSRADDHVFSLVYTDDGKGIPDAVDFKNLKTLGMQLIMDIVEGQLNGKIELIKHHGTEFRISFKEISYKKKNVGRGKYRLLF